MKKIYIKPSAIAEQLETECHLLEYSNQETKTPYDDIETNDLIDNKNKYQEGDGEDAGAKGNTHFFGIEW